MISQKCPKCLSSRVRRGYRPTPFWSKVLFRYNLLCDNCNWEFTGFAVPGTVSAKPTKSPKKKSTGKLTGDSNYNSNNIVENLREEASENHVQTNNAAAEEIGAREDRVENAAEEIIAVEDVAADDIAAEDISAAEKTNEAPVSKKVSKSSNKAKRKSGV